MLETIRKRLHRSKYVFTIHLHHITPWFMDDNKSAVITWKRGNKKNRQGQTQKKSSTKQPPNDNNNPILNIDEIFELEVTLFSESKEKREKGVYYPKELEVKVKELESDKSVRLAIGVVIIKLNEYADLVEYSLKLPIKCEKSVISSIGGSPHLHLTLRSCFKKSSLGDSSTLNGVSRISRTPQEDPNCEECDSKDPVKILEDAENSTSVVEHSKDLIVEIAIHDEEEAKAEGHKSMERPRGSNQEVPVILTQNEDNTITLLSNSEHDRISKIDQDLSEKNEQVMDAVIKISSFKKEEEELKVQDQDSVDDDDLSMTSDSIASNNQEHHSTAEVTSNLDQTQNQPSTKSPPRWLTWISWIPGSQLMCCQPRVPKEP